MNNNQPKREIVIDGSTEKESEISSTEPNQVYTSEILSFENGSLGQNSDLVSEKQDYPKFLVNTVGGSNEFSLTGINNFMVSNSQDMYQDISFRNFENGFLGQNSYLVSKKQDCPNFLVNIVEGTNKYSLTDINNESFNPLNFNTYNPHIGIGLYGLNSTVEFNEEIDLDQINQKLVAKLYDSVSKSINLSSLDIEINSFTESMKPTKNGYSNIYVMNVIVINGDVSNNEITLKNESN